jgi:hypothetical protein
MYAALSWSWVACLYITGNHFTIPIICIKRKYFFGYLRAENLNMECCPTIITHLSYFLELYRRIYKCSAKAIQPQQLCFISNLFDDSIVIHLNWDWMGVSILRRIHTGESVFRYETSFKINGSLGIVVTCITQLLTSNKIKQNPSFVAYWTKEGFDIF